LGRRRRLVARHLRRVYGPSLPERDLHWRVAETFASYARYWEESLRLSSLSRSEIRAGVRYEGLEHIRAGEAAGRGTILALPHLGAWEWGGAGLVVGGHAMSVVVETLHPLDVFEWFVSFREQLGMQVIPTGPGAAVACRRALAANHLLCLLSDRLVGGAAGVEVEFFGERTTLPAGPVTLAMRTGAALLPCAVYFEPGVNRRLGFIRPPLQLPRGGRLRDDVQRGTQQLAAELETLIGRAPTQWHLMQPNWPSDPGWPSDPNRPSRGGRPSHVAPRSEPGSRSTPDSRSNLEGSPRRADGSK
jgi:phosphatidylinositol dimannoside acyltransferase